MGTYISAKTNFSNISGSIYDNTELANALNSKTQINDEETSLTDTYSSDKIEALVSASIGSVGEAALFLTSIASGITDYENLQYIPEISTEIEESVVVNNSEGLIDSYLFPADNLTLINAGVWGFNIWTKVSSTAGVSYLIARVYKRTTGGVETLLFSAQSPEITSTNPQERNFEAINNSFIKDATDRLVLKIFGVTTRNSNTTVSIFHGSPVRYSHIHTPISKITINNLDDLQDVEITTPTDGQILQRENGLWKNKSISGLQPEIISETPTGSINDVNTDFILTYTPTDEIQAYLNGLRLKKNEDFTITNNIITITSPPKIGDLIVVDYKY